MPQSNKFKPCKKCGCPACRRHSSYKQMQIRSGNRKFRRSGRVNIGLLNVSDFEEIILEMGDPFDDDPGSSDEYFLDNPNYPGLHEMFEVSKVGIGYTD